MKQHQWLLICLCVISAASAPLRFILSLDIFTAEPQRTQRLRREKL